MKYFTHATIIAILLLAASNIFAAEIFNGYAGIRWGSDLQAVMKSYPKGQTGAGHGGGGTIYRQDNPNSTIAMRVFSFKDNKLTGVTVKFSEEYVQSNGIDNLIAQHKKAYGDGKIDRSKAPHMITYVWEGSKTRISFAYAPKRLDMTVMLFEQK
jgi:hypothetical protein